MIAMAFCLLGNVSCSSQKASDIAQALPRFVPEEVLIGNMTGEGAIFDRFGTFQRSFVIHLNGSRLEDDKVELKERLVYDTGEEETRTYLFNKISDSQYEATSESGLVGSAKIESVGNILRWNYLFEVPYRGKKRHMRFDDWMFLQKNGSIINRATVYWWGIRVAELYMLIRQEE
jgi:hypothetical protein